jgi:sugar O-acyltransferase (sialic acid O-acetyltransferase NeuD family)
MNKLLLWGSGGHGKVVLDIALAMDLYSGIAFIDDDRALVQKEICGYRIQGSFAELNSLNHRDCSAIVVAIGVNQVRARCFELAKSRGWVFATLIHPTAVVSPSARLGGGTVVMPRAVVNAGAVIGENCIVNTAAVVEHDCRVSDHVHLSPGVLLGGAVTVHAYAHMGLGSIALPGSTIGERAVVGAGAVVLRSVQSGETVAGVPARTFEKRNRPAALRAIGSSR